FERDQIDLRIVDAPGDRADAGERDDRVPVAVARQVIDEIDESVLHPAGIEAVDQVDEVPGAAIRQPLAARRRAAFAAHGGAASPRLSRDAAGASRWAVAASASRAAWMASAPAPRTGVTSTIASEWSPWPVNRASAVSAL